MSAPERSRWQTPATEALRRLPRATLIYSLGDFAPKALYFFLLPWYLRYLDPAQFGILTLATTFSALLGFFLQLNLNGSVFRFYLDQADEPAQLRFVGTLVVFQVGWSFVIVLALNVLGPFLGDVGLTSVRVNPYLRLATGLAFVTSLPVLPLAVLQMRHEAGLYRGLTFFAFLLSTAAIAGFVVWLGLGAYGFLLGQVLAGGLMLAAYALAILPRMRMDFATSILRECLSFSLPLVPYAVGGWVMDMSNRYLIEANLGVGDVGRYNLGYQFALVEQAILNAFALAWLPVFYRLVREERAAERLARFGTLYWSLTLLLTLGLAVLAKDVLAMFVGRAYRGAYAVVPVLVATQALTCLWHLVVNPLFLVRKTGYLPVVMAVAAVVSVALNRLLIPSFGLVGAALAVFVANAALTAITAVISLRFYPVGYSYGRMGLAVLAAVATFYLANGVALASPGATFGVRALTLALYPVFLLALGVLRWGELRELWWSLRQS